MGYHGKPLKLILLGSFILFSIRPSMIPCDGPSMGKITSHRPINYGWIFIGKEFKGQAGKPISLVHPEA